ncbi:MAG: VWA domain-containing protein [Saprospirales bacterium]|nr:VWA domain-containing protein [Saprospirales bacterium]
MFKFEHPTFLNLLWAVPVMGVLVAAYRWWRGRAISRLGAPASVARLAPGWSGLRFFVKNGIWILALALLAIAWANPQRGARKQTVSQKSADIFLALDISQSMLAQDVAPSRLELAKSFARKIVDALHGERIGLIFFAGDAFLQMPLSTDYGAAIMFIDSASPDLITAQGTALTTAIDLAMESFDPEPGGGRALILITDGENHDADAEARAAAAYSEGIVLLAVGAGTTAGGPIPVGAAGGAELYKRDDRGDIVRTRMDETLLHKLAGSGGGAAFRITQGEAAVAAVRREVGRLQKREMEVRSFSEYDSYFQWFLLPAFLLLVLEAWLSWRKKNIKALFGLLLAGSFSLPAQTAHELSREGDRHYERANYREAEAAYRRASEIESGNPHTTYNTGNAIYQQGNYAESEHYFERTAQAAKDPALRADALHNLGNAYLKQQEYKEAVSAYERSLRLRPGDPATKVNLQIALKKQKQQQAEQERQQQQNQQPPPPQNPGQNQPQQPPGANQRPTERSEQTQPEQTQPEQSGEGRTTREQARRILETAVAPEDQRNARKYRRQNPGKHQTTPKKDW